MNLLLSIYNCDTPTLWGLHSQDAGSPQMEALIDFT